MRYGHWLLGKLRQKDHRFKSSLGFRVNDIQKFIKMLFNTHASIHIMYILCNMYVYNSNHVSPA